MKHIFIICVVSILSACSNFQTIGAKTNLYSDDICRIFNYDTIDLYYISDLDIMDNEQDRAVFLQTLKQRSSELEFTINTLDKVVNDNTFEASGNRTLQVVPRIINTYAKLDKQTALWDGVRHPIRATEKFYSGEWSGSRPAISLELNVYDHEGRWIMKTLGGISMPYIANMRENRFIYKDRLFNEHNDIASMNKGINKALDPFSTHLSAVKKECGK